MLPRRLAVSTVLALALLAGPALAATSPVQGTGQAKAAVANSCVVVTTSNLSFGAYSPVSGLASTTSGQVALKCTKGAAFTISPSSGGTAMRGSGGTLSYGLYVDSAMTQQWGVSNPAKYVAFDTTSKYNGQGYQVAMFGTTLTAAQFAANPTYATQPYAIYNNNGVTSYSINYLGQPTTPAQLSALAQANPGSVGYTVSNFIVSNTPVAPPAGAINFIVPTTTTKSGTVYQVPTGFTGQASLSGTATSALTAKSLTYYGKVPASQDLVSGSYTDTVVLTVSF